MRKLFIMLIVGLALFLLSIPSYAHFQMLYNENSIVKPGKLDLKMVFTHPFEAGHTMDMGKDENGDVHPAVAFGELHRGKKQDLMETLKPVTFTSLSNSGKAYEAEVRLKGMGDHVFYFVPAPYYEARKDFYIQQCTKTIFNVAGAPTDWHAEVGEPLPVEIVPLVTPYALWTGNVFRGQVTCGGRPVPGAKIRIEYMNHDIEGNAFVKTGKINAPHNGLLAQFIRADENGVFIYAIPRAGWWGFAALGAGGKDLSHQGKKLRQDAVIWVQAFDMK